MPFKKQHIINTRLPHDHNFIKYIHTNSELKTMEGRLPFTLGKRVLK